jgi:hypothetical protein
MVKPFTVKAAPLCLARNKLFFKPLLDSLSKNYIVNQPHLLPILNLSAYEVGGKVRDQLPFKIKGETEKNNE